MSSDDSLSSSCSSGSESSSDDSDDDAETMLSLSIKKLRSNSYRYYYFQQGLNQEDVAKLPRPKRKRKKKRVVFYLSEDGTKKVLVPEMSWWYLCYVKCPAVDDNTFLKRFRRRFRLPYPNYLEILSDITDSSLFDRWKHPDAIGNPPAPLSLLVLTALRYLGRGWTFDDLSEATGIGEEVCRVFFHTFIEYGSTILFDRYVLTPENVEDAAKRHEYEFRIAGLPGAIGSMDATHVLIEKMSFSRRQSHLGPKLSSTARTYNLVVNHRRRILGMTEGHPSRWNDGTGQ